MFFTIVQGLAQIPSNTRNEAFLITDGWDDWFSFQTQFSLWYFGEEGQRVHLGSVKIGQIGLPAA